MRIQRKLVVFRRVQARREALSSEGTGESLTSSIGDGMSMFLTANSRYRSIYPQFMRGGVEGVHLKGRHVQMANATAKSKKINAPRSKSKPDRINEWASVM